jgi:AhpD family alkylhydroperoxidase
MTTRSKKSPRLPLLLLSSILALCAAGLSASALAEDPSETTRGDIAKTLGFVPQFFNDFPAGMLPGVWEEMKGLQLNPKTALPGRTKELIGLGVAAQVPCQYCILAHTEFGKLNGASQAQIGEAVGLAAITRHWSTFLNGIQTDEAKFRAEIAKIVDNAKRAAAGKAPAAKPAPALDGQSALKEIAATLGFAPEFLKRFPEAGRAGAWRQMRDVQLNPATALSGKDKELVGLAVASQVPCRYCVIAHTEFAKLNGASDAEIDEAIAMAAFTRDMSTLLNGMQVDQARFARDIKRLVQGAKKAAEKPNTVAQR